MARADGEAPEDHPAGRGHAFSYTPVPALQGQQSGQDVDGRLEVLRDHAGARSTSCARTAASSSRCCSVGGREHLGRVGDVVDQRAHRALGLGHRRHERRRCPSSRRGRRGSARPRGGRRGSPRAGPASRRRARRAARARRARRAGRPAPRPRARWRAGCRRPRASPRAPRATAARSGGARSATNVPPRRPRTACRWPLWTSAVSAWRSVEREMPELRAQVALGGQPRARLEQAEPDRRAEALERLLERRLRADRA